MKLKLFSLVTTLVVLGSPSSISRADPIPPRPLSETVQKSLTGLPFEESSVRKDLKKQAAEFIASRKGSLKHRLMWLAQCVVHSRSNYFCAHAIEKDREKDSKGRNKDTVVAADSREFKDRQEIQKDDQASLNAILAGGFLNATSAVPLPLFGTESEAVTQISSSTQGQSETSEAVPLASALTPTGPETAEEEDESVPAPIAAALPGLIEKGDVSSLSGATRGQIYHVLKKYRSWQPLERLTKKTLDSSSVCKTDLVANALGSKAEEYFPDPKFRQIAIELYAKAAECKASEAGIKAAYRLSLLQIWDGKCKAAEPYLERLANNKTDYASRALYWRASCAKEHGQKLLYSALSSRLLKEYPLSYHGILVSHGNTGQVTRVLGNEEPNILFRSETVPETLPMVRAVEALQTAGAMDLSRSFLKRLELKALTSEPQFRLYVAMLMYRSGDTIGNFRILSTVFRDNPSLLSQATLKLFYPLKNFDVIEKYGAKLDPYFVAALIRQESGFNANAMSRVGARGFMQLMPATARRMERVSKSQLFNVQTNVRLGVRFFNILISRFDSDAELALAAYNAGPERVDEWKRRYTTSNRMLFFDLIPFKETRDYVALISRNYYWYLNLYGSGTREVALRRGTNGAPHARALASYLAADKIESSQAGSRDMTSQSYPSNLIFTVFK
ncbi:MAG: lytic transglycosylase domain-containing protein [Methylotenera sp.]|nr:lytic transglycosylase domain-containing protein [Oligoflexia bacterium]